MSVLDRSGLEASPLADLQEIASELGIDGFRRMRKAELVDAILARQEGEEPAAAEDESAVEEEPDAPAAAEAEEDEPAQERRRPRRRGGRRRGRGRGEDEDRRGDPEPEAEPEREDRVAEGVVELLGNGSGFVRVAPPDPSDDDVYISAAQVRRCELVSGDVITGPVRPPRRSERYPSLVRVDTINGASADEVAEGTRYEDLPTSLPSERLALGSEDVTLRAIEWLTPFGRGSRVTIVGAARAGKTEALFRLAGALAPSAGEELELSVLLAGVRPEEIDIWRSGPVPPQTAVSLGASAESQAQAVEAAVEEGRRRAARGKNVVLLVDTLDALAPTAARRAMAAARNIADGGSLTIIATARQPVGGETTVIALNADLAGARRFPAIDMLASGVVRPELLVGEAGAEAIAKARAEALG